MPELFEAVVELPDANMKRRYESLVGLDSMKSRLSNSLVIPYPASLESWSQKFHQRRIGACDTFAKSTPNVPFSPGTSVQGKPLWRSPSAMKLDDPINLPVFLYRLSLSSRAAGPLVR